jgi:PAS domain S-box-containing protein
MVDITKVGTFVQNSPYPAWLATGNGDCVYGNPALERLTGLNAEEIIQADWRSFLLDEDRLAATASWQRSLATGIPYRVRVRMRGIDCVTTPVELTAFGHKVDDGAELWLFLASQLHPATHQDATLEAQLQATLQVIPTNGWYTLPSGALTFVNKRTGDYLGLPKDHPLRFGIDTGAAWDSHLPFLHPEDHEETRRVWSTCLRTGSAGQVSFRIRNAEGEYRWFLNRAEPLRTCDGTLLFWIGVNLDIDDAKRTEHTLQRSEAYLAESKAKLEEAQRIAHVGYWEWDLVTNGVTWSDEAYRIYGLRPQEFPMDLATVRAKIHPEDWKVAFRALEEALSGGARYTAESRIFRPTGEVRIVHSQGDVKRDTSGQPIQMFGTVQDITDRKHAEEALQTISRALQESKAKLEEAQAITHVGYWEWDLVTDSIVWSDEIYRIFGMQPQECQIDLAVSRKKIHPDDWQFVARAVEEALAGGVRFDVEARILRPTGEVRVIHSMADVKRDASGRPYLLFGTNQDITDQKRAEQEHEKLRQLEAELAHINRVSMLGEMAASLAHEIKQPIAAAITSANTCIEWLGHEPPNLDRARAAAARIDKYGNRAADIIDRIRSMYKKAPSHRELVDANEIVLEIFTLLRGETVRYSIEMRTELATEVPKIMADRVQLQQVFMNLALNAIEAMNESGGELTVKSQQKDGQLLFSVSDTGPGLPVGSNDQIFSAFYTTKPQGSGMGLAISRTIVESHGGRLWATANEGRGATFHFALPTEVL